MKNPWKWIFRFCARRGNSTKVTTLYSVVEMALDSGE